MKAVWQKYRLDFRFTAITSRDSMTHKDTYYIKVWHEDHPDVTGVGEAALFRGLSCEDSPEYEEVLDDVCAHIDRYAGNPDMLAPYPSIRFGVETALRDLANGGTRHLYDSAWSAGESAIRINGLIWMGDRETMNQRIRTKLDEGFRCIKVKIGGIDFNQELEMLRHLRRIAPAIEIRLDANGAFSPDVALEWLNVLAEIGIHSIEQPIRQGQWEEMARICSLSPIPVALDEELIGLNDAAERARMLDAIRPSYIILKPTLIGGLKASEEWIAAATQRSIGWWATSALESNIGLNAIAQWVATQDTDMPQGLGTGQLYYNNVVSPLTLDGECLVYDTSKQWGNI